MERIKSFEEFVINEAGSSLGLLGDILNISGDDNGPSDTTRSGGDMSRSGGDMPRSGKDTSGSADSYTPTTSYKQTPGNDDFVLYMQHQQGVAGAAGIVKEYTIRQTTG
jgi:hypothetical protein